MPERFEIEADERAVYVRRTSYSFVFKIIYAALVVDIIYRYLANRETSWDLLGILAAGGLIAAAYQVRYKTMTHTWIRTLILSELAPVIVIVFLLFIR
jgi:hypothetical protein